MCTPCIRTLHGQAGRSLKPQAYPQEAGVSQAGATRKVHVHAGSLEGPSRAPL